MIQLTTAGSFHPYIPAKRDASMSFTWYLYTGYSSIEAYSELWFHRQSYFPPFFIHPTVCIGTIQEQASTGRCDYYSSAFSSIFKCSHCRQVLYLMLSKFAKLQTNIFHISPFLCMRGSNKVNSYVHFTMTYSGDVCIDVDVCIDCPISLRSIYTPQILSVFASLFELCHMCHLLFFYHLIMGLFFTVKVIIDERMNGF